MLRHPPDILITTPESLYLMLTSQAQKIFDGTEQVIVDEIHAVAQTKRGAHLALTLERLAEAAGRDVQRIGLSAPRRTRSRRSAASWSARKRTCAIVDTGVRKPLDLKIHVPVESMVEPGRCGRRARPVRGHRHGGDAQVDLAGDLPEAAGARPRAHEHADLRQQPARRRAARAAAERARRRAHRPRAPRLAGARGAPGRRGACSRPASCRAWWRRRRSSSASTWARSTSCCRSSRRSRSPPACSGSAAPATTSATPRRAASSRSSAPTCSSAPSSPSGCARARSRRPSCRATRSTCSPSRSSRSPRRARTASASTTLLALVTRTYTYAELSRAAARERARHARRPLPVRGVRRAARRASCGTASPGRSAPARAPARWRSPTPARSPTAACSASTSPTAAASASSTRRWSTRRGPGRRSCSARRPGGSRRSRATA